jgi:glycosyltransferase involved in cell wall biosynthesis
LIGETGWLSDHLQETGVPFFVFPFQNPRFFLNRILGLSPWAEKAIRSSDLFAGVRAIVANDFQDTQPALALSHALQKVPVLSILRTPSMSSRDFYKHRCDRCHGLVAVGEELKKRVKSWTPRPVGLFLEGFRDDEFVHSRAVASQCPPRVLVIGSESPRKGFADFMEALRLLEKRRPDFPGWECFLTGNSTPLLAGRMHPPMRSRFAFLGRVLNFRELVTDFAFAVHPSRAETFGIAPIESLIAGTPTLTSTTGIIQNLRLENRWVFPPTDIEALSDRLQDIWENWEPPDMAALGRSIHANFNIEKTSGELMNEILKCMQFQNA